MRYFAECTFEKTASVEQKKLQFFSPRIFFFLLLESEEMPKKRQQKCSFAKLREMFSSKLCQHLTFYEQDEINAVLVTLFIHF
jgi:hypothetical protein